MTLYINLPLNFKREQLTFYIRRCAEGQTADVLAIRCAAARLKIRLLKNVIRGTVVSAKKHSKEKSIPLQGM